MGTERLNFIFRQYPETVRLSESRRANYWKHTQKVRDTIQAKIDKGLYKWKPRPYGKNKSEICLYDEANQCFLVKNPTQVGKPRIEPINGQRVWMGGAGSEHYNRAVKEQLRVWFVPALIRQNIKGIYAPLGYYIHFEYIFYYPFAVRGPMRSQDYLNHGFLYMKAFEDILQEEGWLKTDSPEKVRGGYMRYVSVSTEEERRLEVKVHTCRTSERIS